MTDLTEHIKKETMRPTVNWSDKEQARDLYEKKHHIVCTSTNFNCTFLLDLSGQKESEPLEKTANKIRQETYDRIKAKYGELGFSDANTNTELFLEKEHPASSSYYIGFALPVPGKYSYPPEKTEEFEKNITKELESEFGASVNWEGGERVEEVFQTQKEAQDYITKIYGKEIFIASFNASSERKDERSMTVNCVIPEDKWNSDERNKKVISDVFVLTKGDMTRRGDMRLYFDTRQGEVRFLEGREIRQDDAEYQISQEEWEYKPGLYGKYQKEAKSIINDYIKENNMNKYMTLDEDFENTLSTELKDRIKTAMMVFNDKHAGIDHNTLKPDAKKRLVTATLMEMRMNWKSAKSEGDLVTFESPFEDEDYEVNYSYKDIEALLRARDVLYHGNDAINMNRPDAEQLKAGFEKGESFENCTAGTSTGKADFDISNEDFIFFKENILKPCLKENVTQFKTIDFSRDNFNSLFPRSRIETPLESVRFGSGPFSKFSLRERRNLISAVYETLTTPDIILKEERMDDFDQPAVSHNYAKNFFMDKKSKMVQSVIVEIESENVIITSHERPVNEIVGKIKQADQILYIAPEIGSLIRQHTLNEQSVANQFLGETLQGRTSPLNKDYNYSDEKSIVNLLKEGKLTDGDVLRYGEGVGQKAIEKINFILKKDNKPELAPAVLQNSTLEDIMKCIGDAYGLPEEATNKRKHIAFQTLNRAKLVYEKYSEYLTRIAEKEIIKGETMKKEMDKKITVNENPEKYERYISKRIIGAYTPLNTAEVRLLFVNNNFRAAIDGLSDELYETIKNEMRSSWAEEFVSRNKDGKIFWHDIEGEEGFEFAEVDRSRCESVLQNCIETITAATRNREDQSEFLRPLEQLMEEHEKLMSNISSEERMRKILNGITSTPSGKGKIFDQMLRWVREEFPERDEKAVLQDTVSRMIYDNVDFADFGVPEYDDRYGLGDGGDYRWSLAEDAAKKLIGEELSTMEEVQNVITAHSHEMKRDLLAKSDDRYMMMTADRILAAGEIIMSKYEDYPELKSFYEQYYEKKANKTLALGELCEEKLKEIAEHYNNGEGLVTMETINDDTETVEITYTPSEIEALIKGRDAYLVGEESLDFIRPNAGQLEIGFREGGYKFDDIARGCAVFTGQEGVENAKCIEQIDSMNVFASDSKAAEQWARDTRGKLLVEGKDIFLSGLNGCVTFIDTTKNRERLKDYLLDKPLEQKFDWTGFSEECFDELKKDILSGRLGENYDASVKDYRGTVNIGNIAVDITFREKGRTSLDYDFYILGQKGEGERHGVPYDYESGETFDLIGIRDNDYETFKKFFEKEVTDTIAKREDLLKEAVQPTIDWRDEKAVKDLYSKKLGNQLAREFATLDFKPDTWNELIEKGADPREALAVAAEDANLGDNLNWLLDRIGNDKLREYFSNREFADRVFDNAKESMTHDLSNSLSDIGDREGFMAFPAFYTSAITRLAELTGKTGELLSYGDELLIKEEKAVRVEPYTRDEKAMQAVRNALARMEGYGDENEIGTDKVTAFIDNIGNENNHMVIGLGDAAGYMNWYDKAHNGMEYKIPEILAQIESWAEGHAAVAEPDSEQARDYGYIQELRKYHPIQNNEIWKHLEEQFRNAHTFHGDFSGDFSKTKKEVLDYYVDSNTDYDEKKWQEDTVYRLLEENINFGILSETKDELDSPDHSEKMEQRSGILEKLSERIVAGEITVEQAQGEADKLIYDFEFDWSGFTKDNFRKLKEDIERGKVVEGSNYGSVHVGSISIDLCWRDNPEGGSLLDIDFYTLGEKGIGGQIELDDGTEIPYDEYFAGQIGFDSVKKYSYEEFKKAYEDVLEDLLIHGEDSEHYITEAQRPLVNWDNEKQVRELMDEKMKEAKSLSFSDDLDKMRDFDSLTKEEFLDSYSYLTEQQYDATARELSLKGVSGKEQAQELESKIAAKVFDNICKSWNWGGNAIFDKARAWNPEEYGIHTEDDRKVHVLIQFHDNHGKGSCPTEKQLNEAVNKAWHIQELHADGVEVIGLNSEISGTIDQYLSKLKENGLEVGIDSGKTRAEVAVTPYAEQLVRFEMVPKKVSLIRNLFDGGNKPENKVTVHARYNGEELYDLHAFMFTPDGKNTDINLLTTDLLDEMQRNKVRSAAESEVSRHLTQDRNGLSVREAYLTDPVPSSKFNTDEWKELSLYLNDNNRDEEDPPVSELQAKAILHFLEDNEAILYCTKENSCIYLLDVSEDFNGIGAKASNEDIIETAMDSLNKAREYGTDVDEKLAKALTDICEKYRKAKEKTPVELADEIAKTKEREAVPDVFKKELVALMRSDKLAVKDPFIATKVILDAWKKDKPQNVQSLNEYLKKSGCTSKEGFEKFFREEVGLQKKQNEGFQLKKKAHKNRSKDGIEGRS